METLAAEQNLLGNLAKAAEGLRTNGRPMRAGHDGWRDINAVQFRAAATMQEMARVLRLPSDMLHVLKEARDRLDRAIVKQAEISKQTKEANDPTTAEKPSPEVKPGAA